MMTTATATPITPARSNGRIRIRDGACVRHAWLTPHPADSTLICGRCNRRYDPRVEPPYKTQAILRSLARQTIDGHIHVDTLRQTARILIAA